MASDTGCPCEQFDLFDEPGQHHPFCPLFRATEAEWAEAREKHRMQSPAITLDPDLLHRMRDLAEGTLAFRSGGGTYGSRYGQYDFGPFDPTAEGDAHFYSQSAVWVSELVREVQRLRGILEG